MIRSCRNGSDDYRCYCVAIYLCCKKVKTKVLVSKGISSGAGKMLLLVGFLFQMLMRLIYRYVSFRIRLIRLFEFLAFLTLSAGETLTNALGIDS